jgi:hypothetical protein
MTAAPLALLPVIKGNDFTERMARIFASDVPARPLPGLRYRRIMIPAISGGELHFAMLGLLAKALEMRGADVTVLLCDAMLPACAHRKIDHYESACTRWCHRNAGPFARAMRLKHRWYSEFVADGDAVPCEVDASLHALVMQSTTSYFKVGAADFSDPEVHAMVQKFTVSATIIQAVARGAFATIAPDKIFMDNGVQVDWGVFRAVAAQHQLPVDVVQTAPRPNTLQFEFDRPGNGSTVRMPLWEQWKDEQLTAAKERALDAYLASRERVPYLVKNETWSHRVTDPAEARRMLNLPAASTATNRTFVMFTNVGYDEGVTKGSPAYMTGAEWIADTVAFFARHPQHTLIIKAHPGEKHLGARDPIDMILDNIAAAKPANVHVIDASSPITAPCAARLADVALLYTSTVSVEVAALNIPTILVGDGLHSRRGFAHEPATPADYIALLSKVCAHDDQLAPPSDVGRRYAYAYFFRSAIPIALFDRLDHELATINIRSANELAPGCHPALDAICRGILCDEPIVNPLA